MAKSDGKEFYGLIGGRLGHSYSPEIHAAIAPYAYALRELAPEEVGPFLRARQFRGLNVTIPYKQAVIPFLDVVSETARAIGAVNTIVNRGGRLYGDNTDAAGFAALLRHAGVAVRGKKCLVLGTGGTSRTVAYVLRREGAAAAVKVSRGEGDGANVVSYGEAVARHHDAAVIVNTTPVGMFPKENAMPIGLEGFLPPAHGALEGVLDVVYHPLRTRLVLAAQALGIPAEGGLYMLAAQAVAASALFLDRAMDPALTEAAFRAVRDRKRNLVLVGMPSSGKSTVGRLLAERLGKRFVDTDAAVVAQAGCSIAEVFAAQGEAAFRALERQAVAKVSQDEGVVVATGGGVVLDAANVAALKQNGLVVFLDRPPEELVATPDRPLSTSAEAIRRLYDARLPLYRAAADISVATRGLPPAAVADAILERSSNP